MTERAGMTIRHSPAASLVKRQKAAPADEELATVQRWMRRLGTKRRVPKVIWHVWLGSAEIPQRYVESMASNSEINHDYITVVLTDRNTWRGEDDVKQRLASTFAKYSKIQIMDINDDSAGMSLSASKNYAQYCAAVGRDSKYPNFAAGADLLRYFWLHRYGGIYLDHDEQVRQPFGDVMLTKKTGIALSGLYEMPALVGGSRKMGYSLSHFAVLKDSFILADVLSTMAMRYEFRKGVPLYDERDRNANGYINEILETSGNLLFTQIINERKKKFRGYYADQMILHEGKERSAEHEDSLLRRIENFNRTKFPLRGKVQTGNAHTWLSKQ